MNTSRQAAAWRKAMLPAALLVSCLLVHTARSQTAEALMEVLVRKGILTEQEAEDIKADLARENADANRVKAPGKTTMRVDLYGDFRGRFEGFWSSNDDWITRQRWRYRARLGLTANLTENFQAGFRIGSGDLEAGTDAGVDPISQNQTLQNNGSKKGVFIDLAYGKWRTDPTELKYQGSITVGKMENPFVFTPAVFDRDYTPEGVASQWTYNFNLEQALSMNVGGFVLDEIGGSTHDPFMLGAQLRYDSIWAYNAAHKPRVQTSFGAALLSISNNEQLSNASVPNIQAGNTRTGAAGVLEANFNPIVADASFTYWLDKVPLYNGMFPIKVNADYLYNPATAGNNQGFSAGIAFGKASLKATWDISYEYRFLESDVWYEELVDSDFGGFYSVPLPGSGLAGYRSGTNVKGHVIRVSYAPYNALTLNITWFDARPVDVPIGSDGPSTIHRVQFDANLKF